jgi:hypothetical protein
LHLDSQHQEDCFILWRMQGRSRLYWSIDKMLDSIQPLNT